MVRLDQCGTDHQCLVPWVLDDLQMDWVDHIITIETWLEQWIGTKGEDWEWCEHTGCRCLVFKEAKYSTLFTLRWH